MSDSHENRAERSITPNKLYSTYGEAHRNIAARGQDTPRNSDDGVDGRETLPTSPDTIGTEQPSTPNLTIFRGRIQEDVHEDQFHEDQFPFDNHPPVGIRDDQFHEDQFPFDNRPVGSRPLHLTEDDAEYQLPVLPAATYDPRSPGQMKNFGIPQHCSAVMKKEDEYEEFPTFHSETSHPDVASQAPGRPLTRQYQRPPGHDFMLPRDRHSDESLDEDEYAVSWDSDQGRYRFLKKGAEKEVSQALRQYTGNSQPSVGTVVDQNTDEHSSEAAFRRSVAHYFSSEVPSSYSQAPFTSSEARFPSPYNAPAPAPAPFAADERRARRGMNFYNNAAIQSGWQTPDNGIRVPTSPPPPTSSGRVEYAKAKPWSSLSLEQLSDVPLDDLNAMQSVRDANRDERDDWETVTDERAGSCRQYHNTPMGKRAGGSSIADYSDRLLPEGTRDFGTDQHCIRDPAWWEKPSATVPKGSMKATEGTAVSGFMTFPGMQSPDPALEAFNVGFVPNQVTVRERDAQIMLNNSYRHRGDDSQYADAVELTDLRAGRESTVARDAENSAQRSWLPFRWSKVKKEVGAQQAQRDAELAELEPRPLGRPLSGFDLPFDVIELEDARRIQAHHRASGLEDQSETGNFVFHHSMVNRPPRRLTVASNPRRPALNAGPDYYTPLSPTTGQMIQPGVSRLPNLSPQSAQFQFNLPQAETDLAIRLVGEGDQFPGPPEQAHLRGNNIIGQGRRSVTSQTDNSEYGILPPPNPLPLAPQDIQRINTLFHFLVFLNLVPGLGIAVVGCRWWPDLVLGVTRGRAETILT